MHGKIFHTQEIISSGLVQTAIRTLFAKKHVKILQRTNSIIIIPETDAADKATALILLPPHGFTANAEDEATPYPELRHARLTVKGGVRPGKHGFNPIKKVLKYCYYSTREVNTTNPTQPYVKLDANNPSYKEEFKTARQKFFAVKENGSGFYHNLVNTSNEWVLLVMEKELRLVQKHPCLDPFAKALSKSEFETLTAFFEKTKLYGDQVFEKEKKLVEKVAKFNASKAMPALIEMLNVLETGMHEPCSVFAVILKIAKKNSGEVLKHLKSALQARQAPSYYLKELIWKVEKMASLQTGLAAYVNPHAKALFKPAY